MELEYIVSLVTIVVSFVLGFVAKKNPKMSNKLIPMQNLLVGVIIALIEFAITKDFNLGIMASGLLAGGTYDLVKNLRELLVKGDE